MSSVRPLLAGALFTVAILLTAGVGQAQGPRQPQDAAAAIANLAVKMHDYLVQERLTEIDVGRVQGPSAVSAGVSIQLQLIEALHKVADERKSTLRIERKIPEATIRTNFEFDSQTRTIVLVPRLYDVNNQELERFRTHVPPERIDQFDAVVKLMGVTIDPTQDLATANLPNRELNSRTQARFASLMQKPQVSIVKHSQVSAREESLQSLEVLVRTADGELVPQEVVDQGGRAFVDLRPGQEFEIRVHNRAAFAIGVELNLDGVNSLVLCEDAAMRQSGKWVVRAGKSGRIKGWLQNKDQLRSFVVTGIGGGILKEIGASDLSNVGTITAAFYPAWLPGEEQPTVERFGKKRGLGAGEVFQSETKIQTYNFGETLVGAINVRYERSGLAPEAAEVRPLNAFERPTALLGAP